MTLHQEYIQQCLSGYQFSSEDFDLSHWRSNKESVALAGGRGASQKIVIHGQFYVLRQYLRGGLIASLLHDKYFWTGLMRSRPFQENKITRYAIQNNLPVPEVVAYCVQKQGLLYRAFIISRFISNVGTLAAFVYENEMPGEKWFELGRLIKRLHQANIYHADLNANNILIDEAGKFYIIDFDKAELIAPMGHSAQKNIQRLLRSLKKIQMLRMQQNLPFNFNNTQWQQLLAGYK